MSLTFMAVHAHPDDEASSTGGVLARYAKEGFQTVVVTCTNGELGDLPGGIKPDAEEHDEEEVVRLRMAELDEACRILDVTHLELLDSAVSGDRESSHRRLPRLYWKRRNKHEDLSIRGAERGAASGAPFLFSR